MLTVKGTVQEGVARPDEPLEGFDGKAVLITILDEAVAEPPDPDYDPAADPLLQLIERCQVDTGITDLAHQHDHYLYGTPKKPPA
jgi:hypothetical protein